MEDKGEKKERSLRGYLLLSLYGFAMGAANVIPGVSGGTMAFLLGIYEELIEAIRSFASWDTIRLLLRFQVRELLERLPWKFVVMLGIGVLTAFASLAKFLTWCLEKHEVLTFAFFFGLVLASIITVLKRVKRWSWGAFVCLLLGTAAAYFIVTLVPVETAHTPLNLFLCGMIIICAMILPGISGSFLLLVLGQYKYVLAAVTNHSLTDMLTLLWVGAGCVVGLGSFVHLLNWLFRKFHDLTIATLIGFMIGSLWKLWPWHNTLVVGMRKGSEYVELHRPQQELEYMLKLSDGWKVKPLVQENILPKQIDATFWYAVGLALLGLLLVVVMEFLASRRAATGDKS